MIRLKVIYLKNPFQKSIGLIGKTIFVPVYFKTRFGIHTFGMKVPIDILILDSQYKIVKMKEVLNPNSLFFWNIKYSNVIELPQFTITNEKLNIGQFVLLEVI